MILYDDRSLVWFLTEDYAGPKSGKLRTLANLSTGPPLRSPFCVSFSSLRELLQGVTAVGSPAVSLQILRTSKARHCGLARMGHSHHDQGGKLQIVFGMLTDAAGCPAAPAFFLKRLVLVGDRGMIASACIREDFSAHSRISWITALRATSIQKLAADGAVQPSLFDTVDLAEMLSPINPGERLEVCFNHVETRSPPFENRAVSKTNGAGNFPRTQWLDAVISHPDPPQPCHSNIATRCTAAASSPSQTHIEW